MKVEVCILRNEDKSEYCTLGIQSHGRAMFRVYITQALDTQCPIGSIHIIPRCPEVSSLACPKPSWDHI